MTVSLQRQVVHHPELTIRLNAVGDMGLNRKGQRVSAALVVRAVTQLATNEFKGSRQESGYGTDIRASSAQTTPQQSRRLTLT